ncbi:MFS transporter [Yoonia maricola]|nr:MFS transporter [Yoonia maricola]
MRLVFSGGLTALGDQITLIALSLYAFFQFESTLAVAALFGIRSAAGLVGLALRHMPDLVVTMRALAGLDILRMLLMFAMIATVDVLWVLIALFFLQDVIGTLQASARMAMLSQNAARPVRQAVNALDVTASQVMRMLGAIGAAAFFDLQNIGVFLGLNAVVFLLAALLLIAPIKVGLPSFVNAEAITQKQAASPTDGAKAVELQLLTIGNSLISASIALFSVGIIPYLAEVLNDPQTGLSLLQASQFGGLTLAGLAIFTGLWVFSDRKAIVAGNALLGLATILMAQSGVLFVLLVLGVFNGLCNMVSNSGARARLMAIAPQEALGGHMQVRVALGALVSGIAALASGWAIDADIMKPASVLIFAGVGFAAYSVLYAIQPSTVRVERKNDVRTNA